jgi:transposase, IS6 family
MKVAGRWRYVYRAIDQFGQAIDVYVSPRRNGKAAYRLIAAACDADRFVGTVRLEYYEQVL